MMSSQRTGPRDVLTMGARRVLARWFLFGLLVMAVTVAACSEDAESPPGPAPGGGGSGTGLTGGGGSAPGGGGSNVGGAPSCADLGGTICGADQFCSGSWLDDGCCDGPCELIPTCDGEPMVRAPDGFLSIDVYEIRHTHPAAKFEEAARLMGEAHVSRVKKPLAWRDVEPSDDDWDFAQYDALFQAYADQGVEIEIELIATPGWASSCEGHPDWPGLNCSSAAVAAGFPPVSMDDWRDYVTTVVTRYADKTDRWAIWAEPDRPDMWRGSPDEYVAHLNAAQEIIAVLDPDAEVLGPQMNVGSWVFGAFWDDPNNRWREWIDTVSQDGEHDVFSIHILLEPTVDDIVYCFEQVRAALDALGQQAMPITVSSTQILGVFPALPGAPRDLQCPYIDPVTHDALPEAAQAAELTRIYACLANAGAQGVSWFRISDLDSNPWLSPCPGAGCNCDPSPSPPPDACQCANPDPDNCNFWCPPDGIDRSGILGPYDDSEPVGARFPTKESYDAVQLIGAYLQSP